MFIEQHEYDMRTELFALFCLTGDHETRQAAQLMRVDENGNAVN